MAMFITYNCLFTRGYVAIISHIFLGLLCQFAVVPNWGDTDGSLAETRTHDHHQPCCRWSHGRCAWAEFAQLPNRKRWPKRGFTGEFRTPNLTLIKNPQLEKMPRDTFDTAHQSPKMPKVTSINQSSFDLISPVYQVQNLQNPLLSSFFQERDNEETRFLVSWEVFAKQSETFLLFSPDLNVARARTLAYFQEVEQDLGMTTGMTGDDWGCGLQGVGVWTDVRFAASHVGSSNSPTPLYVHQEPQEAREQGAKIKHIFQWERDGWSARIWSLWFWYKDAIVTYYQWEIFRILKWRYVSTIYKAIFPEMAIVTYYIF